MAEQDLAVYSPEIKGQHYRDGAVGRGGALVRAIEVFATIFRADAWECAWHTLDPVHMSKGWGLDIFLYAACHGCIPGFRMGVDSEMMAFHTGLSIHAHHQRQQANHITLTLTLTLCSRAQARRATTSTASRSCGSDRSASRTATPS
mmetsp:Transcript_9446/g.27769  ORF Transcript_9446/g.27769 Transcript_9446/m.27769 type:complete len:147 (-) Transcript_9446:260-700(-)